MLLIFRGSVFAQLRYLSNQKKLGNMVVRRVLFSTAPIRLKKADLNLEEFTPDRIRNFSVIAHVDHGKSTLADRLLELTGTVERGREAQILDKLEVERERGITVKAQTASMIQEMDGTRYLLNLIDTPGHVDFHYEVSRSLSACEGVLLLIDANQGVQAQTVANFWLAYEKELYMIPVLNKIDLKEANPDIVEDQIAEMFDIISDDTARVSGKTGQGVETLLTKIIHKIPPPKTDRNAPFKALIFDSWFVAFRGPIALVKIHGGSISRGDRVRFMATEVEYEVGEVGVMNPEMTPVKKLYAGQVGYIVANMKTVKEARIGDTICASDDSTCTAFPGFKPVKPMVFAGLFPVDTGEHPSLRAAVEKLALNDPAVSIETDHSPALGQGWRVGFLGLLHMEVFGQRLDQEYGASVILTAPSVKYKALIKDNTTIQKRYGGVEEVLITDPSKFPEVFDVKQFKEPVVMATIISPMQYVEGIIKFCTEKRGSQVDFKALEGDRTVMRFRLPLAEVIVDFFSRLKQLTSGYASFDYEDAGYVTADVIKIDVALNGRSIEEFSAVVPQATSKLKARDLVDRLIEEIPRQMIDIDISATFGKRTLAKAKIKAYKKDFTQTLKGNFGDPTRLRKLIANQEKGKKKLKTINNIQIPKEAFINVLRRN